MDGPRSQFSANRRASYRRPEIRVGSRAAARKAAPTIASAPPPALPRTVQPVVQARAAAPPPHGKDFGASTQSQLPAASVAPTSENRLARSPHSGHHAVKNLGLDFARNRKANLGIAAAPLGAPHISAPLQHKSKPHSLEAPPPAAHTTNQSAVSTPESFDAPAARPARAAAGQNAQESQPSKRRKRGLLRRRAPSAASKKGRPPKTRKQRVIASIYYLFSLVTLVVGAYLAYQAFYANKAVEQQVQKLEQKAAEGGVNSSSLPTDVKPKDPNFVQNHKVAPLNPRTLSIPKLGVTSRVIPLGDDAEGRMDVPKTAYDVGWYMPSSRPGEHGAMVIDGHVLGIGSVAVFSKLHTLAAGDQVVVERGDGTKVTYKVVAVELVPLNKVDMGKLLVSKNTNLPGLNLITCGGSYDPKASTFTDRTIVYTVQA